MIRWFHNLFFQDIVYQISFAAGIAFYLSDDFQFFIEILFWLIYWSMFMNHTSVCHNIIVENFMINWKVYLSLHLFLNKKILSLSFLQYICLVNEINWKESNCLGTSINGSSKNVIFIFFGIFCWILSPILTILT